MAVEHLVAVGALINMFLIWMFDLRLRTHLLLGGVPSQGLGAAGSIYEYTP